MPMDVTQTQTGSGPANPSTVSLAINGAPLGDPVIVTNTSFACGGYVTYEFSAESLPGYRPFERNTFSVISAGHAQSAGRQSGCAETRRADDARVRGGELPRVARRAVAGAVVAARLQRETGHAHSRRYRWVPRAFASRTITPKIGSRDPAERTSSQFAAMYRST